VPGNAAVRLSHAVGAGYHYHLAGADVLPLLSTYVFSVPLFHVPQGRSEIAQRFIAGLWREHKTSPVRDERTHRSNPIFSVAPPGLWPFSTRNPRLKPWATLDRPYRDFGIRALPSFNMRSTTASSLPFGELVRVYNRVAAVG
jgi:hypothetical protein